jgi:hypothetical protein
MEYKVNSPPVLIPIALAATKTGAIGRDSGLASGTPRAGPALAPDAHRRRPPRNAPVAALAARQPAGGQLPRIGHGDLGAAAHAPARHGQARSAQPQDEDVLVLQRRHAFAWAPAGLGRGLSGVGRRFSHRLAQPLATRRAWALARPLRQRSAPQNRPQPWRQKWPGPCPGSRCCHCDASTCCDARGLVCDRTQLMAHSAPAAGASGAGSLGAPASCLQRRGHGVGRKNGESLSLIAVSG